MNGLEATEQNSGGRLSYDRTSETLTVHGTLDKKDYQSLLACCGNQKNRADLEQTLRDLRDRSPYTSMTTSSVPSKPTLGACGERSSSPSGG